MIEAGSTMYNASPIAIMVPPAFLVKCRHLINMPSGTIRVRAYAFAIKSRNCSAFVSIIPIPIAVSICPVGPRMVV
ncbi:Uncharacterised protein [uncultured archaeon]|nr:Uncharacterised protein [uncultured archaeon]